MQERRNKRLFMLLILLTGITVGVYWMGREGSSFEVDKNLFRNYDLQSVDEVRLESPAGKVHLSYQGARWKVNQKYNADRNMIEVLFATLQQAEPKRPVASSRQDSVSQVLEQEGVHVALLSKGNVVEMLNVGGNAGKTQAYFKKGTGKEPYLVTIPGYRVYVSGIFELPESGWREKYVFNFNWRNFQRLEAKFPDPAFDFSVAMNESSFGIEGLPQADTAKLNNFLDAVSLLTVDEYRNTNPLPDSLSTPKPAVSLTVGDIAGRKHTLTLFPLPPGQFAGIINDEQWAIFSEKKIRAVLRPKGFFLTR